MTSPHGGVIFCENNVKIRCFSLSNRPLVRKIELLQIFKEMPCGADDRGADYGKGILETGKYAVSGTGSDGELSTAGRETEYYHDCMGGNGMLFTGHGIDFCQERAVFL